jgi:hypothetical protein
MRPQIDAKDELTESFKISIHGGIRVVTGTVGVDVMEEVTN